MAEKRIAEKIEHEGTELAESGKLLVARDRYVLVFALIMVSIALNAFLGDRIFGVAIVGIALVLTMAVTLVTSESRRLTAWVAAAFGVVTLLAAILVAVAGVTLLARFAYKAGLLGITLVLGFVIGRRIVRHPVINLNTLAGAASIYLLFGLFFALAYSFLGGALSVIWHTAATPAGAFFASARPTTPSDFLYFSYVTLTTVGYGDLTASTEFGRMLSVTEALLGQLYLVTVVAVLVSNMGHHRGDTPETTR